MRAQIFVASVVMAILVACAGETGTTVGAAVSISPFRGYGVDVQHLDQQYAKQCDRLAGAEPVDAAQAIALAGTGPEFCQPGVFRMTVLSIGRDANGILFLDSQSNYQENPSNLAVSISPRAEEALRTAFGGPIERVALTHRIVVQGVARRIRIDYQDRSGRFYFQTHVPVDDADQLEMLGTIKRGDALPLIR